MIKYFFILLFLCPFLSATAQTVQVTVHTESGDLLPGASVKLSGEISRTAITDSNAAFRFQDLPAGTYFLKVNYFPHGQTSYFRK